MKETSDAPRMKLGFHKFYTFFFLPLSVAFAFFVAYGRFVDVLILNLYSFAGIVEALHTLLPFCAVVTDLIVLVCLLGFMKSGRILSMVNACLQAVFSLFLVAYTVVTEGFSLSSFLLAYALLAAFSIWVYVWYLKHPFYFPKGGRTWKETRKAYVALFLEEEEEETPEETSAFLSPVLTEDLPEETEPEVEKNAPEEESAGEEAAEEEIEEEYTAPEEEEKEDSTVFSAWTIEGSEGKAKKLYAIMECMFSPLSPLQVLSTDLKVMEGKTEVTLSVVSRSALDIAAEEWLMNGKYPFRSNVVVPSGSKAKVKALVNAELDRVKATLVAVEDIDGERKELDTASMPLWPMPEKVLLSSLSKDDRYQWFLRDYLSSTGINAKWCATGNLYGKAVTCPVCGNPMVKDEKYCPVCGLSAADRGLFEKDTILTTFQTKTNG